MPELPEVETTRRSLAALEGARILAVALGKPLRWPLGIDAAQLQGQRIGALQRRGKYIWMPLHAGGAEQGGLLWHLGMSGALMLDLHTPPGAAMALHEHVRLHTSSGLLRLTDPRRFGAVVWASSMASGAAAERLAHLGPEPLGDWTADALWLALQQRRGPIKPALMDAQVVVGVGNIYASEALFDAGIDPRTPCHRIGRVRVGRLHAAVRGVLERALASGGSTLRNYTNAQGRAGAFQDIAKVYGRAGEPCLKCGGPLRRLLQGQRATYWCPRCQR